MKNRIALVTIASVTALLMGSAYAAHAAQTDLLREMQDRKEIEALMWRYCRSLDTLDAKAYAAVYTQDGQFGSGRNAAKGRAGLEKMIADLKQARAEREAKGEPKSPPMYHMIANSHLEFIDKDHARLHSYWMTVFGAAGQDTPTRIAAAGRGIDELVRVNGQWLIQSRNVAPQD